MHRSPRWIALVLVSAALMALPAGCTQPQARTRGGMPVLAPAAANGGAAPAIVLEQAYYVPFENIEQVFERTGRGIFLPYEKFLELWNASRER